MSRTLVGPPRSSPLLTCRSSSESWFFGSNVLSVLCPARAGRIKLMLPLVYSVPHAAGALGRPMDELFAYPAVVPPRSLEPVAS